MTGTTASNWPSVGDVRPERLEGVMVSVVPATTFWPNAVNVPAGNALNGPLSGPVPTRICRRPRRPAAARPG